MPRKKPKPKLEYEKVMRLTHEQQFLLEITKRNAQEVTREELEDMIGSISEMMMIQHNLNQALVRLVAFYEMGVGDATVQD